MNVLLRWVCRIYGWSIALYPVEFRDVFGDELRWVFDHAARDRADTGLGSLARFCLHEVVGWTSTVWIQHFEAFYRRYGAWTAHRRRPGSSWGAQDPTGRGMMTGEHRVDEATANQTHTEAVLAALPLLLFGLAIAVTSLVRGGPWYTIPLWRLYLSVAIGLIPMVAIGVGAVLAIARRMPDWGWSWIGATLIEAALFVQSFVGEAEETGQALPGWVETALTLIFFAAGIGLLLAAALRGWRRAGLFTLAAAGTFGLSMFLAVIAGPFFRHDLAPLAAPLGLVYAGLVFVYMRTRGLSSLFLIAAVGVLNAASFFMANQVWSAWLVAQSRSSPLVPLIVLGTGLLLSGPAVGLLLRPLRGSYTRPS